MVSSKCQNSSGPAMYERDLASVFLYVYDVFVGGGRAVIRQGP